MTRRRADLSAIVAARILKGPCSVKEICEAMGITERHSGRAMTHVRAFRAQGLIYVSSYSTRRRPVYAWQPSPWLLPDSPKPESKDRRYSERRPDAKLPLPAPPARIISSVFALGAA